MDSGPARGARLRELLKQPQSAPLSVAEQVVTIFTGINGYLDDVEVSDVREFLTGLREYVNTSVPKVTEIVVETNKFTDEAETLTIEAIGSYKESFFASKK